MYEFTHAQFWALLLTLVGVVGASIAWYYEHQLKQTHASLDRVDAELRELLVCIAQYHGNPRKWNVVQRLGIQQLAAAAAEYLGNHPVPVEYDADVEPHPARVGDDW